MPVLKLLFTNGAKLQFQKLKDRADSTGNTDKFVEAHDEVIAALRDLGRSLTLGEPMYRTKKPGGEVRHFIHKFISVSYVVFKTEQIGWILKYLPVPESWPE